ncbi:MAG: ASKHA domain-containing protein [Desulfobacterales bacterium]|nr:ASKHA domain-containing protein [Desulfobacterales bacterium]
MEIDQSGWIQIVFLPPPSLQDNTADADRLVRMLKTRLQTDDIHIELSLLKKLPRQLRNWDFKAKCLLYRDRHRWILLDIKEAQDAATLAGLAVDLGTTTVVLRLIDLLSGTVLIESSFSNPQLSVGPDILTRVHFAGNADGLGQLHDLVIAALNESIRKVCSDCNLRPDDIYFVSVAGNTVMTHLFMGLNPDWIIREPYIPVVNRPGLITAPELGIAINPQARVLIFPNAGSYFGGDLVAGILFSGLHRRTDTSLLVDVGTNAEVVLGNRDWLVACAGAAGPALEGGASRIGTLAGPGVIDHIEQEPDKRRFRCHTIDGSAPMGICGSGLIELAAHLFATGMIDNRGRFVPENCGENLKELNGAPYFIIVPANLSAAGADLGISQTDLGSLIRSKAAMYSILETITASVGISLGDIATFYVAGTFGSIIKPEAAVTIGMLPDLPLSRFVSLGNSSIGGATMALTDASIMEEIDAIRDRITYLELNVNQEFMTRFSAARFLPHTDLSRFPSVKVRPTG